MTTIPLDAARDRLRKLVARVERTHDRITITRDGRPVAMLVSHIDLTALQGALDIMTSKGTAERIRQAVTDAATRRLIDLDESEGGDQ